MTLTRIFGETDVTQTMELVMAYYFMLRTDSKILPFNTHETMDFNHYYRFAVWERSRQTEHFFIINIPRSSLASNLHQVWALIEKAKNKCPFIGDFKLPTITWSTGQADAKSRPFLQVLQDGEMTQLVEEPTHIKGNILDLVLTNYPDSIEEPNQAGRLRRSDHTIWHNPEN